MAKEHRQPTTAVAQVENKHQAKSLVLRMAAKYGVEGDKLLGTLRTTCFRGGKHEVTNEQMLALLAVANEYGLNVFLKELHAFPGADGSITPMIGVDGFIKIANTHPQFAGMEFEYDDQGEWVECIIERKDRNTKTRIREYLAECRRNTQPWQQWPRRMLRHRALCQAVRVAFGFSGIMETDEAEAFIEGTATEVRSGTKPVTRAPREKLTHQPSQALETKLREQTSDELAEGVRPLVDADEPQERVSLASEPDYQEEEEAGSRG